MPFPALLLVIATLLPLAACFTLLFAGRRLGTPLAGYIATFFIALSFLFSGWAMMRWVSGGNYQGAQYGQKIAPISQTWSWLPIGDSHDPHGLEQDHPGYVDFGIYIDSLTVGLFVTVTLMAMLVHIFAARSMRRDLRFVRFFILLSFSLFSTLALLLCSSLLHMVLLLELVGFAASLLVAFRSEREPTTLAAGQMFLVNRVGDLGLILGIAILIHQVGNLTLPDLWLMLGNAGRGGTVALPGGTLLSSGVLTAAGVALFLGAAARCAQFPMQVWAGDAAEGIAPACAMVFSLSLGLAGAYVIARLFPLLTPSARLLAAIVGATTLIMAALIGCVQGGIKQVLAWGAASQLGFIILAMAVGSWTGGMFHLIACASFQVLLFLAAGAVIRAARGETQISQYGGLLARMPVTALTSLVAILAAIGAGAAGIGLNGYYSRGLVLRHAAAFASLATGAGRSRMYWALFILPVVGTGLTAFLLMRWWMLIFAGVPRDRRLFEHARDVPTLFWPMVVLAILTALTGRWLGVGDLIESAIVEGRLIVQLEAGASPNYRGSEVHAFDAVWPSDEPTDDDESARDASPIAAAGPASDIAAARDAGDVLAQQWLWRAVVLGIAAGLMLYAPGPGVAGRLARIPPISWLYAWLSHRMYFDEFYNTLFVGIVFGLAGLAAWLDRNVLQGITALVSAGVRRLTSFAGPIQPHLSYRSAHGTPVPRINPARARMFFLMVLTAMLVGTVLAAMLLSI